MAARGRLVNGLRVDDEEDVRDLIIGGGDGSRVLTRCDVRRRRRPRPRRRGRAAAAPTLGPSSPLSVSARAHARSLSAARSRCARGPSSPAPRPRRRRRRRSTCSPRFVHTQSPTTQSSRGDGSHQCPAIIINSQRRLHPLKRDGRPRARGSEAPPPSAQPSLCLHTAPRAATASSRETPPRCPKLLRSIMMT